MFILFVLLPLAVSADCNVKQIADCTKCGVGPIGNQFDGSGKMDVCNCNGRYGMFGLMCPKTGYATHPTCCNVDGKTANVQSCECGDKTCQPHQLCTASTSTCADPVCSTTQGLRILGAMKGGQCQCGTESCVAGQTCNDATGDLAPLAACEYPKCNGNGFSWHESAKCKCGDDDIGEDGTSQICEMYGTCTIEETQAYIAPDAFATPPVSGQQKKTAGKCTPHTPVTPKVLPKCKVDVVTTEKCMCQKGASASSANQASIGQTCPKDSNDPFWPACSGSDVFKTLNQQCTCAGKKNCGYGSKCIQSGTYKGRCECVNSKNVGCLEVVQPKGTCPLSCDVGQVRPRHTTIDARPIVFDECLEVTPNYNLASNDVDDDVPHMKYTMSWSQGIGSVTASFYRGACKDDGFVQPDVLGLPEVPYFNGGCQDDFKEYFTVPGSPEAANQNEQNEAANGGTALQITVPALFVVGLLAFVLL